MNLEKNKVPLFGNLSRFKNKTVTVVLINGVRLTGILKSYDDTSNLVLEKSKDWEYGKRILCLGRSLSLITLGECVIL